MQNTQAKKKSVPLKKNIVKKKPYKLPSDQADTINTTKEKTFATIEQTFDFQDHKTSTRTTHYTSRRDCIDKMQANKLSPFSSPGQSMSPRQRKSVSPAVVKQKQRKRNKKKQLLEGTGKVKKNTIVSGKPQKLRKTKTSNNQKIQVSFQNQFLLRFNQGRKITEVSQQDMEGSHGKLSRPILQAKIDMIAKHKKNENKIIKEMHRKIKKKYIKEYPGFKRDQINLLSAVVLVQRLWRQTKVKMMINQFLSPRNISLKSSYGQTFGKIPLKILNEESNANLNDEGQPQQTMKTQKSFPSLSPRSTKLILKQEISKNVEELSSIENDSELLVSPERSSINLRDLEVSGELSDLSSSKAKDILKYVDMYHKVTFKQITTKKKNKVLKNNTFNFPESLSQKCLLQGLYRKRIASFKCLQDKGDQSVKGVDIFLPSRSIQKAKQQYISPKKPEVVELEQRFYTEAQDQQYSSKPQKQQLKLEEQTVSSIGNVASKIIQFLIFEFSQEFQAFTSKKCLKKKKRLPGITVSDETIGTYFNSFIAFVRSQYGDHLENSFTKINGKNFLKFFRIPFEDGLFQAGDQEDDEEELNCPILPIAAFFQYQPIYEQKIFKIKEEDKRFSSFLEGLIKIHNKCLVDSFSDFIQKQRLESIRYPWDELAPAKPEEKILEEAAKKTEERIKEVSKRVIQISNTKLGRLHKRDAEQEQINLLESLKEDYKREGHDWSEHQERLEIRLELTELITQQLIQELTSQLESIGSQPVL